MWDEKYLEAEGFLYGEKPNDYLAEKIVSLKTKYGLDSKQKKALDLGCGEGRNAVFLANEGFDTIGVDRSLVGIEKAQKLNLVFGAKLHFQQEDVLKLTFPEESFGLISSIWLHLPEGARKEVYAFVNRCLEPGGYFILEAYRKEQLAYKTGGPPTDKMMPSLTELQESFSHFNIIEAQEVDRDVYEGLGHHGHSAVIQFLAKKNL